MVNVQVTVAPLEHAFNLRQLRTEYANARKAVFQRQLKQGESLRCIDNANIDRPASRVRPVRPGTERGVVVRATIPRIDNHWPAVLCPHLLKNINKRPVKSVFSAVMAREFVVAKVL